ncbi:hypothetical protein JCM8208_005259 [Rhodotorula glutinis]
MERDEDDLASQSPEEPPQKRVKLSSDPPAAAPAPSTSTARPAGDAPATFTPPSRPALWLAAIASLGRFGRGPYSMDQLGECVTELCELGYPPKDVFPELWRVHTTAQGPGNAAASTSATSQPSPSASTASSMPSTPSLYAPWTARDNERLAELKRQGLTHKEVAEQLGRTASAIHGQYAKLRARDPTLPMGKRGRPSSVAPRPTTSASPARSPLAAASPSAPRSVKLEPRLVDATSPLTAPVCTPAIATTAPAAPAAAAAPAPPPSSCSSSTPHLAPAPAAPPPAPAPPAPPARPRPRPTHKRIGLAFHGPAYERALAALRRLREPLDLGVDHGGALDPGTAPDAGKRASASAKAAVKNRRPHEPLDVDAGPWPGGALHPGMEPGADRQARAEAMVEIRRLKQERLAAKARRLEEKQHARAAGGPSEVP